MRILRAIALSLCLILSFGLAGWAQKDKPRGGGEEITPVTTTLADRLGDRITSDNSHPYVHDEEGVRTFIGSKANLGNFYFVTLDSFRRVRLDFSDCRSAGQCDPPFADDVVPAWSRAEVMDSVTSGMLGMAVGDVVTSTMVFRFGPDSGPWFINFDPSNRRCPGSDMVTVERNSSTTWTVSAGGTACLSFGGKPGQAEFRGRYNMPFSLTVVLK